jgi:hypothetical protein
LSQQIELCAQMLERASGLPRSADILGIRRYVGWLAVQSRILTGDTARADGLQFPSTNIRSGQWSITMLYVDIPSLADLKSLAAYRDDICVSIYLPTTPVSQDVAGDRIELKNLAKEALRQLEKAGRQAARRRADGASR